jgi:hypothetical protein
VRLDPDTFDAVWLGGMVVLAIYLVRSAVCPVDAPASVPLSSLRQLLDAQSSA